MIPTRQRWRPPFIYSPADVNALMAAARSMRWRLPAATYQTLIGLLAVTGMRVERTDGPRGGARAREVKSRSRQGRVTREDGLCVPSVSLEGDSYR